MEIFLLCIMEIKQSKHLIKKINVLKQIQHRQIIGAPACSKQWGERLFTGGGYRYALAFINSLSMSPVNDDRHKWPDCIHT
jgi:hypothetical protein